MSEGNQSEHSPSFPVIKVHILMPDASSSHDSEYVSIKYSKTTTAQEVIDHIKHKKKLPPVPFELAFLPRTSVLPTCVQSDSIVLSGPAIISDIILKVAVQDEGLWWLRETHEDPFSRLVSRDTFNSKKDSADLASLASLRAAIAEEDEAESAPQVLQDQDLAPSRREHAFVARLVRQNSIKQLSRPQALDGFVASASSTAVITEEDEAESALQVLQDQDLAPSRREHAFVARLVRQNSIKQLSRPQGLDASDSHLEAFVEETEEIDEL